MMKAKTDRKRMFERGLYSIRTRYALVTAFFLFLFLGVFYVGGRWMLANLVYDTASQVRDAGMCVTSRIQHQTDDVRQAVAEAMKKPGALTASPRELLSMDGLAFSFIARFSKAGDFVDGAIVEPRHRGAVLAPVPAALTAGDFADYAFIIRDWSRTMAEKHDEATTNETFETGILRLQGRLHYAAFVWRGDDLMLCGLPFSVESFVRHDSDHGAELRVRAEPQGVELRTIAIRKPVTGAPPPPPTPVRAQNGISPMFTETEVEGAHPSFWGFRSDPLETVFVLRDISGHAISELSVSLPKVFSSATRMAIWQLAFFIAFGGILFVLPIFWAQNRLLLNPLTRMTKAIAELGLNDTGLECPRIAWEGKDEFAVLAESVNRMVETIAAKTVSLANVEARHKALIAGVPDALIVFDPQGRLVSVTKEPEGVPPIPGLTPGALPSAEVYGEQTIADFVAKVKETYRDRTPALFRATTKATAKDPARHIEVRLARMGDFFVLAIVRDITRDVLEHERRVEAEARASDASKRESLTNMAAGIAHDMNNVLAVVSNTVEQAEANPQDDKVSSVASIRDAVRRGVSLMRELSAYAGEGQMRFERADPKMILEDVRQLATRIVGPQIELSFDAAADAPDVDADLSQFWKVIFNLVKNAGEAIGKRPGRIALAVKPLHMTRDAAAAFVSELPLPEGDGAVFSVADDGPGISPEVQSRIFDPYVSSKGLGRGLGLATVRTIVEAHGGGIRVASEAGRGTTFLIYLPASKLPKKAEAPAAKPADGALSGTILVVDDDVAILKTTRILCKAIGLDAHLAVDRREALAIVRRKSEQIRAILLDAHLGAFDTVRLLAAFRLGAPGVPIIIASGSGEDQIAKMFKAHPYDAFLPKPYTLAELRATVQRVLATPPPADAPAPSPTLS